MGPVATPPPDRYAIVALMGHRQVAGRVSEEMFAGAPMCRVDIPLADGTFSTRLFGGSAIYEVTFVAEGVARAVAGRDPAHPVSVWSARSLGLLPQHDQLPAHAEDFLEDDEEDEPTDLERVRDSVSRSRGDHAGPTEPIHFEGPRSRP